MSNKPASRRIAWLALIIIVLFAVAIVAAPVWIIQPFRAQTERGVAVFYLMRSWSPYVTLAALIVSFILVGWIWSGSRRWFAKALDDYWFDWKTYNPNTTIYQLGNR